MYHFRAAGTQLEIILLDVLVQLLSKCPFFAQNTFILDPKERKKKVLPKQVPLDSESCVTSSLLVTHPGPEKEDVSKPPPFREGGAGPQRSWSTADVQFS